MSTKISIDNFPVTREWASLVWKLFAGEADFLRQSLWRQMDDAGIIATTSSHFTTTVRVSGQQKKSINMSELSSETLGAPACFNMKNYCGSQGCETGPFQQKKTLQPRGFSLNAFREREEGVPSGI